MGEGQGNPCWQRDMMMMMSPGFKIYSIKFKMFISNVENLWRIFENV